MIELGVFFRLPVGIAMPWIFQNGIHVVSPIDAHNVIGLKAKDAREQQSQILVEAIPAYAGIDDLPVPRRKPGVEFPFQIVLNRLVVPRRRAVVYIGIDATGAIRHRAAQNEDPYGVCRFGYRCVFIAPEALCIVMSESVTEAWVVPPSSVAVAEFPWLLAVVSMPVELNCPCDQLRGRQQRNNKTDVPADDESGSDRAAHEIESPF